MPVEVVGLVHHNAGSMLDPKPVSEFDPAHIARLARLQEEVGFDRVLIANTATMPDSLSVAMHVAAQTSRLKMMIAQRPGFIAPTMAGRMLATIDRLSGGRASVHIIAGASDAELKADGDYLTKEERYHRAREYVAILRQMWTEAAPFDVQGAYYKAEKAFAPVKPLNGPLPVFWGGSSDLAIEMGVQSADVYALTGDALAGTSEMVAKVKAAAARYKRPLEMLMTMVLIVGESEAEAWRKADHVLARVSANVEARKRESKAGQTPAAFGEGKPIAVTFQRLVENAQKGDRLDKCFWSAVTRVTNAQQGNTSTLVGTPDQIVDALLDYYDLGISRFLLRGYETEADAALIGRTVIPRLRAAVAQRDGARLSA